MIFIRDLRVFFNAIRRSIRAVFSEIRERRMRKLYEVTPEDRAAYTGPRVNIAELKARTPEPDVFGQAKDVIEANGGDNEAVTPFLIISYLLTKRGR